MFLRFIVGLECLRILFVIQTIKCIEHVINHVMMSCPFTSWVVCIGCMESHQPVTESDLFERTLSRDLKSHDMYSLDANPSIIIETKNERRRFL